MKTIIADLWDKLRTSLWFVPALMAMAGAVLAILLVLAQDSLSDDWMYRTRWLATGDADGARQILATIAGSVITVTGVIFSVTLVALSLASQQFGPRLLRMFMRDRGNQFVLGTFIGTFVYSMLVLRVIHEPGDETNIPYLAVTFAAVLALAALGVLIYFIHHVVASIQADTIIVNVSRELHETMNSLYGDTHGDSQPERDDEIPGKSWSVQSKQAGYVRALDDSWLMELADKQDLVIELVERPGRFVVDGSEIARVHSHEQLDERARMQVAHRVRASILIGPARTAEQDIEYSIAQLVEIAVRSLSPSLNDPFTAMACVDRLGEAIIKLGGRDLPKVQRFRRDGRVRLMIDRPDFAGLVNLAFDQIRQHARGKPAVIIRMLDLIAQIIRCLHERPACFAPLLHQAALIARGTSQDVPEHYDREVIAARYANVLRTAEPEHVG